MIQRTEASKVVDFQPPKRITLVDSFKEKEIPSGVRIDSAAEIGRIIDTASIYTEKILAGQTFLLGSSQNFLEDSRKTLDRIDPEQERKDGITRKEQILDIIGLQSIAPLRKILVRAEETIQELENAIERKKRDLKKNPYSF